MNIQFGGAIITVSDDEIDTAYNLECVCGHKLRNHGSYVQYFYPDPTHHTLYNSQCTLCPDINEEFGCKKFQVKQ